MIPILDITVLTQTSRKQSSTSFVSEDSGFQSWRVMLLVACSNTFIFRAGAWFSFTSFSLRFSEYRIRQVEIMRT